MRTTVLTLIGSALLAGTALTGPVAADPATPGLDIVGLAGGGTALVPLTTVDTRAGEPVAVTGLVEDRRLVGIDFRPQDGELYGVGDAGGVYLIDDVDAGAAVLEVRLSEALDGSSFGVDFNPAANALRVISDTGQNLRQPFTLVAGAFQKTVADKPLNYATSPTATATALMVTGAAYTNNDATATVSPTPANDTQLFDIDALEDTVSLQSPPNDGRLTVVAPLGVDVKDVVGFDIYSNRTNGVAQDNAGYALLKSTGGTGLYRIAVPSGTAAQPAPAQPSTQPAATFLGKVQGSVTDIAIAYEQ